MMTLLRAWPRNVIVEWQDRFGRSNVETTAAGGASRINNVGLGEMIRDAPQHED